MIETNILVIGGGPAGATVAKYLSRANIDTILLQKKLNFKKPCGGGIRFDAFDEFALDKCFIKKKIDKIILSSKDTKITVDISKTPLGIIDREEFDNHLRSEAKKAGVTLHEAKLIDLHIEDKSVVSKIKFQDGIKTIKSRYLIAADGVNSSVRKRVNGDKVSSLLTHYADLKYFLCEDCEFHFGSNISGRYYAWVFPESNGANIGTLADGVNPYIQNFVGSLDIKESVRAYGYKIPEFHNPLFYKQRVFFVGDSASQVLPFTYEGIYYAMSSAKILSDVIIEDLEPLIYEQRWNKKYLKKFTTLQKLQKIFLYSDFTIGMMMQLCKSDSVQKQIIQLWLTDKTPKIGIKFFLKVLKKIVRFKPLF